MCKCKSGQPHHFSQCSPTQSLFLPESQNKINMAYSFKLKCYEFLCLDCSYTKNKRCGGFKNGDSFSVVVTHLNNSQFVYFSYVISIKLTLLLKFQTFFHISILGQVISFEKTYSGGKPSMVKINYLVMFNFKHLKCINMQLEIKN